MKIVLTFLSLLLFGFVSSPAFAITFSDNFDDGVADGWIAGAPCGSPSWCGVGNWRVESSKVVQDQGSDDYMFVKDSLTLSSQTIQADILWHDNGYAGLTVWRYNDDNWVVVSYPADGSGLRVKEKWCEQAVCGRDENVSWVVYPNIIYNRIWQTFKLEANSVTGEIKAYLDGQYLFTHTVGSNIKRSGLSGFTSGNAGGSFDNFVAASFEPLTTKDQCLKGGWSVFTNPLFKNQGECLSALNAGMKKPSLSANVFQISTNGAQQNSPLIWDNTVVWNDWRGNEGIEIWKYDLINQQESLLKSGSGHQVVYGLWGNKIVYSDESVYPPALRVFDITTGLETEVVSNTTYGQAAIFGNRVLYVEGRGFGDLYVYNLDSKERKFISSNVNLPSIWDNTVVWTYGMGSGLYGIRGYELLKEEFFDISAVNDGYQSSPQIHKQTVVWLDASEGKRRVWQKDLLAGEESIVVEEEGTRLSSPSVSGKYISWVDDMGTDAHDIFVYSRQSGQVVRLSNFGSQQASPTVPDLYSDTVVWMSWHTGNGDIYGAQLKH